MDWLVINYLFINIVNWWPWIFLFTDVFFIQFIIIYTVYLVFSTNNLYFCLFYLFLNFFYFGLFISLYNLELFTAFLWLTELVIIFISVLLLFYLNVYGNLNKLNIYVFSFKYFHIYFAFILLITFFIYPSELEFYLPNELNLINLWDDYYEALFNIKINDLFGLYVSYYVLNSLEFILIGVLLLIASLVCVNLNKFNNNFKINNYYELLTIYDFLKILLNFYLCGNKI